MSTAPTLQSTTQQFLDIFDITNDLVIMKDGATSLILTVNAINFGLFAEEEQDAVIYAYAGLLNSLNYSIQIVVKSQTKDITSYLRLLQDQEDQATSEEQRQRIARYRAFVGDLIHEGNVLDKKFYVVIPANSLEMGLLSAQTVVPGVKAVDISNLERSQILEKAKSILEPKRDHLISQFARIGLQARQLTTQEIIQLFYTSYNPEAAEGLEVTDTKNYTIPIVSAAVQTGLMNTLQSAPNLAVPQTDVSQSPAVEPVVPQPLVPQPVVAQPVAQPTQATQPQPIPAMPVMPQTQWTQAPAPVVTPSLVAAPTPMVETSPVSATISETPPTPIQPVVPMTAPVPEPFPIPSPISAPVETSAPAVEPAAIEPAMAAPAPMAAPTPTPTPTPTPALDAAQTDTLPPLPEI